MVPVLEICRAQRSAPSSGADGAQTGSQVIMPLRDYILNNIGWKLLSVISAVLIWWAIHSNVDESFKSSENRNLTTRTASHTLEVTVMMKATDMRRFAITPKDVEVTVRGDAGP